MNVREITKKYLEENGYDGLYLDGMEAVECGCHLSDLMPCNGEVDRCKPGCVIEEKDGFKFIGEKHEKHELHADN